MAYGEMKGLLGSADGVGGVPTPEGLSPEGTKLFHNPSALNMGNYLKSKGLSLGEDYTFPGGHMGSDYTWYDEDELLENELEGNQGYYLGGMEDEYGEGAFWADEIGGILGQNPMHPYGAQNVGDLVRMAGGPMPYGQGEASRISQVAKDLLNRR